MLIKCNLLLVCVNTHFLALTLVLQFRGTWVLEKENSVNTLQVTFWVSWSKGKLQDTWISSTSYIVLASLTNRASYNALSVKSWKPWSSLFSALVWRLLSFIQMYHVWYVIPHYFSTLVTPSYFLSNNFKEDNLFFFKKETFYVRA